MLQLPLLNVFLLHMRVLKVSLVTGGFSLYTGDAHTVLWIICGKFNFF